MTSIDALSQRPRSAEDPFVDRERQLEVLRQAWERASEGHGGLVLVAGAVGTGRTRLAEELGRLARERGARTVFGALSGDLLESSTVRAILLVLDDLEAAGAATISTLPTIATEARRARLLIVATLGERSRLLDELAAERAALVRVEALDDAAVARFAELLLGVPLSPRILTGVVARTGGNALFLRELLRLFHGEGWLRDEAQAVAALRSWRRMRDVVERRIASLSTPCQRLLKLAARQGSHFDVGVLRETAGDETEGFLDRLDEAERAAVVGPSPWRPGQYRFAHPVVADAARAAEAG